jgi:hypothetical protein
LGIEAERISFKVTQFNRCVIYKIQLYKDANVSRTMTPEQAALFCSIAQLGIALGLSHRYEWLTNYLRMLGHGLYSEIPQRSQEAWEAALAFEKGLDSCPEEALELKQLTIEGLSARIGDFYNG